MPLSTCISQLPVYSWPMPWPARLNSIPQSLLTHPDAIQILVDESKYWSALVSDVYLNGLPINWTSVRNVMDMNARYGG